VRYGFVRVSHEWICDSLNPTLIFVQLQPTPVRLLSVGGYGNDFYSTLFEIRQARLKCVEFCGAHEREIFGVEKQQNVFFSDELIQREIFNNFFAIDYSIRLK
jgi:hypothetical protein